MDRSLFILLGIPGAVFAARAPAVAQSVPNEQAMRAAIHPVDNASDLRAWLSRAPVTRDFPPDLDATLRTGGGSFLIEMTTGRDCIPCGDLWVKLGRLGRTYGWQIGTINQQEAMIRSGKLGLPWVGHPVAWVRSRTNAQRIVPVAIGTDHEPNLARNLYLAAKMLEGVRPAVGVRAMSKFTGIVGMPSLPKAKR